MTKTTETSATGIMIPVADIVVNPLNKRIATKDITELAENIKAVGLINPITVRDMGPKKPFMIIAGERRFLATKANGEKEIHCIVKVLSDEDTIEMMLSENLSRENLSTPELCEMVHKLMETKKYTRELIATRLGKSIYFVNQMLQVKELIPKMYSLFNENRLDLQTALKVARYSKKDQEVLFKGLNIGNSGQLEISDYDFRQLSAKLKNAIFDIAQENLIPKQCACTVCPFNSANQVLLFKEQSDIENATCLNKSCFDKKTEQHAKNVVEEAKKDPAIQMISSSYGLGSNAEKLIKEKYNVLDRNKYEPALPPEEPDWNYYQEEVDEKDCTLAEAKAAFKKATDEYKKDLEDYNKKVAAGKFVTAVVVDGSGIGQKVLISINKKSSSSSKPTSAAVKEAIKEGTITKEDLGNEIRRITDNASRKQEIEDEKVYAEIYTRMREDKTYPQKTSALLKEELIASVMHLNSSVSYGSNGMIPKDVKKLDLKLMAKMKVPQLQAIVNQLLRIRIIDNSKAGQHIRHTKQDNAAALVSIATLYAGASVKKIMQDNKVVMDKYCANAKEKIDKLKSQIKAIQEPVKKK